jgi:hypothetical protein
MFNVRSYLRPESENAEYTTSNAKKNERVKGLEQLDAAFDADGSVHAIAMQPKKSL